jgi:hypothetical protein
MIQQNMTSFTKFFCFSKAYISQIRPIYDKEIHGFFESARLGVTRGVVAMPQKTTGKIIFDLDLSLISSSWIFCNIKYNSQR